MLTVTLASRRVHPALFLPGMKVALACHLFEKMVRAAVYETIITTTSQP